MRRATPYPGAMTKLQLISFDLDHTLFDFDRTLDAALLGVSRFIERAAGRHLSPTTLQETRNQLAQTPHGQTLKLLELRQWSFATLLEDLPDRDRLARGAAEVFDGIRSSSAHPYPETTPTLRTLSERYLLAAVTNGNTDPERTALAGLFRTTVFAETCGLRKPDPRIFRLMMTRAGITEAGSVLHVGDSLHDDVHGGQSAGCSTVWFNPDDRPNDTGVVPNYEIQSLRELPEIAQRHARR